MRKGTLFLFGALLVLAGLLKSQTPSKSTHNLLKSKRKIASTKLEAKELIKSHLNVLVAVNPAQHVKVYQEVFNPRF